MCNVANQQTVLETLQKERVFAVTTDGKTALITELCDEYFSERLTRQQLYRLAQELKDLADNLSDDGDTPDDKKTEACDLRNELASVDMRFE